MNSFKYFENRDCKYYPCHNSEHINCLFCYCPFYMVNCLGTYTILPNGLKDCSACMYPHEEENYKEVISLIKEKCFRELENRLDS